MCVHMRENTDVYPTSCVETRTQLGCVSSLFLPCWNGAPNLDGQTWLQAALRAEPAFDYSGSFL